MKVLIQRVKKASVKINGNIYSSINKGILVFLGVEKNDCIIDVEKSANKVMNLRIFPDENDKMNLSLLDIKGEILIVSQFTLCGNCKKGTRPSFDNSEKPEVAELLYEKFIEIIKSNNIPTQTGKFGAMMDVEIINDGPVTFMIELPQAHQ